MHNECFPHQISLPMRRSLAPSQRHNLPPDSKKPCKQDVSSTPTSAHESFIRAILSQPFRVPIVNYSATSSTKTLGYRKAAGPRPLHDPDQDGSLVLFTPNKGDPETVVHVVVDPALSQVLRPHQREGVKFMYDCLTGVQIEGSFGCIMADEMGLGKTLQTIAVAWTLIRQSPTYASPTVKKAVIVTPSSLVRNWANELKKWLGQRVRYTVIEGGSGKTIDSEIESFLFNRCVPILILSYETLRLHIKALKDCEDVGLIICDEGHRLKNSDNQTYKALSELKTKRRLLLSGTPIQNDLLEYFSLVHFVNNGILGTAAEFRKQFENHILKSRDAYSTDKERTVGLERLKELVAIVNRCMIRRTNALLSQYLPVKTEIIVCCRLTDAQKEVYEKYSKTYDEKSTTALAAITTLKKICNHPSLVNEAKPKLDPCGSGKFMILDGLLALIKATSNDKVVLVSNYTQTIDLFEDLCRLRGYGFFRLDGSMASKKRDKLVAQFNDPQSPEMVFLLSSKAGGCGLNIIGANRLVMFDPDWNPASDAQAMARVWRDGQKKPCFVYRLISTGSIEEKIFQRQTHKNILSSVVVDDASESAQRHFSFSELRELFKLDRDEEFSSTHSKIKCTRCVNNIQVKPPSESSDVSSDLTEWRHHSSKNHFNDDIMLKKCWNFGVTFVFSQQSHKTKKVP